MLIQASAIALIVATLTGERGFIAFSLAAMIGAAYVTG
jgi:hypothetical protein